eukprot:s2236_g4.t1
MYVERSRSRDDPPSTPRAPPMSWGSSHHASQLPLPPSSSTSSDGPASRDVVIVADFSELHYLADENWNFSAMHPLNHIPLSLMEEKALWQYTRYVYSNQVDTYMFDQLRSGIAERVEEQWQISINPDDLDLRYDENQGLEVEFFFFKLVGDWNMAQRMGNYWRQHYGLDTYPVDTPPTPPSTPTLPTDALDTPIAVAVQLIREMRNLPLAASIDEYNNQLLALVGGSGISPRLSSVQLETLAVQFHQLAQVTSVLEQQASNLNPSSPGAADHSPDDNPLEDMEDDPRL